MNGREDSSESQKDPDERKLFYILSMIVAIPIPPPIQRVINA